MFNRLPCVKITLFLIFSIPITVFNQIPVNNFYFGNLHAHTWYSDGNMDQDKSTYTAPVARAIEYGRTIATNLNWLAIADHNHNEGCNMTMPLWLAGVAEADTANKDSIFVGIFGQEWGTLSTGGHVLIFGTHKLFGWNTNLYDVYVAKGDYLNLWSRVKQNNGFCYLAHPNNSDFGNLISNPYNASYDSVIQGTALKSGKAFSTNNTQSDPSSGNYESYYHSLLRLGYHVAPTSDQDNHYTNFGMSNQQRTVVLAPSLTRENILNSLRNRRVYASEDNNTQVQFEVGNNLMGDIFSSTSPFTIRVKVSDATPGDGVSRIEIRYGVPGSGSMPTILTSALGVDSLVYIVNQTPNTTNYYYIYVQQVDGHRAWTAPMWITTLLDPNSVGQDPSQLAIFKLNQNYPNPFNPTSKISFTLSKSNYASLKVYDVLGKEVAVLFEGPAEQGKLYEKTFDGSALRSGVFFYKLQSGNMVEVKKLILLK